MLTQVHLGVLGAGSNSSIMISGAQEELCQICENNSEDVIKEWKYERALFILQ